MAKTLAEMKAAMQKELEEEQKRLEREEGKRFSSSQTSGNSSSGKTSNVAASLNNAAAKIEKVPTKAEADAARANKEADLIGAKDSAKLNKTNLNNRDEKKKKAQEEKSIIGNLVEAAKLDSDVKTEKGITLENRDEIKAQKQKEYFEDAKEPFQNIIENAKNDKEIKERVNPQNREEIREEKREDVWKSKEDDSDAETLLKGLGNRARSVPGKLIQSGAKAFYDVTDDTVKGYEEGDKVSLENRDAAKAAKIRDNSAWILNPAREKAAEVAAGNKAEGVSAMATEQLDKLRAKTDNALVQDLISAADGGATMLGYMALPFGTKYLSLYMGASQAVDTYNAGRANGQSKEEAAARGITDGAISMAIESIGGIGKIPGLNAAADVVEAAAAKNFISNLAVQAFQEGGEGFAEAVLNYVGNVVNDLLFKGEIQTSFSFSEALHNAFVEGLSGAMFGAGSFGVAKISGVPGLDASLSEVSQDIIAGVKSVLNIDQTKANPPEALIKAKPPVPFEGTAEPGTEAGIVADKISEIENRPISEAEKAAKIEEIMEAVKGTEGLSETEILLNETEKFKNIHEQNAEAENIEKQSRGGNFIPALKAHIKEIIQMPSVASVTKNLFSKDKGKLTETVWNYFESIGGRVNREGFGDVILAKSGIKKSVISGMSEEKAKAFEVVPEVIKEGRQIDFQHNFKNRGYDTYTFAAPYDTENGKRIVGVIVKKDNNSQRYYLHEVVDENGDIIYKNKETSDDTSKSGSGYKSQITGVSQEVSNNIIHPVSGFDNTSTIGNSVFGTKNFDNKNIFNNKENDVVTETFEKMAAETISAEISDSARRVVEQMKERPSVQKAIHEFEQREAEIEPVKVPQSKKSERIEKRYQKAVEDGVASVFGIDRRDIKNDIRPILNEIAEDVKDGKTITDEQIDALYKQAFDDGYISEEFPQYQQLRKYVREKPFYVSPETRHEFGDDEAFREFARENFGNFKVSTDPRNRSLDDFYKTMAEMAPEFFTEGETDPRTQLEDISDFMNQTKKQYFGLSEVYSGTELADFESWAKKELKAYMNEFGKGLDNVRRYELDRQIKATNKAREMDTTASFEQAKAAFSDNRVFEAQKAVEKAKANTLLNDMDNLTVKKLLEGTINEADVIALGGNVEGILEVYNAEKAYRAARAPFDKYKAAYKTALQHDAIELTTLSDEFTDKKIGAAYSRETAERNVKDIAGKSAGKIIEEYFTPVHENEAMKTRWIKELNQRVADLELGRMNRWERAYAQMIGENAAYIAEGRMTKHDQNEHDVLNERISALLDKHGKKIDKAKCEKAAAGLMGIYEDILEEWNDERIRRGQEPLGKIQNYFPHFTETRPENTIQKIFSWFGFDIGNSKLPTDIAGRTADRKPQSKYNPHAQRRTTDVTDYDIFKGFDGYVRAVGDNIFHTEDIQKLRTLSDTIRTKYSSAEIEKRIEEIRNRDDLSEADKETLIADTFKSEPGAYHLSNFVVWLDEYTNILAGKKSRGDREAEYQMGREIYDISKALEGRIASNMIGYNLSTPVMNLVPMFQATADVPPQDILSSFVQTGLAAAKGDSFISDNSDFLTNRFGVDSVYKKNYGLFTSENVKDAFAKISDGGAFLMEFVDRIAAESLVRARYEQNIKKGMDKVSAFSEADSWAAGLMADRSTGALPTVFNIKNPIAKGLTMFQIEVNNQYSYIFKDAGKYKLKSEGALNTITGQLAFWVAMRICNGLAEELLGRDNVVPDPIGMSAEALAKIVKGEKVGNVLLDTGKATFEQLPFVGGLLGGGRIPLSTALPDVEQLVKGFDKEIPWEKRGQILGEELLKPLSYFFLPSGAGQIWKTGKGVKQLIEGGAFGMENDGSEFMKFPQEYDPESIIKTLLFGQYASDRGQEYIDSNFKSLSAKDTANMNLANEYGVSNEDFFDTVLGLKEFDTKEEKQDALFANEDLSAREKSIIDWVLFGDGKGFPEATRDYTSEQAFWESGLLDSEIRLNEDGFDRAEIRLIEWAFENGKGKKVETIENIQKAMDCTEPEAYEIYQRRQGKWIDDPGKLPAEEQARAKGAAELYGMSAENFLKVLNFKGYGIDEEGKFSDKAEDVVPKIIEATGWSKEKAEEYYNRVFKYDYSVDDLEEEQAKAFGTSKDWYGVEEKGYFTARNIIKTAEGTTDKYGNTVSGSVKKAAVEKIAEQLKIDETEATIYYLAANGDLAFSKNDLSSSHQEDLEAAKKEGWTERQYLDAVNLLKVSGATKKDDIIKTLMDGGASYEMAQGFYNLRQNKDYDRTVSTGGSSGAGYSYGMKTQKQADKGDYFLANYNSDGSLTAEDIANWYAAAAGCNKKQEYLDAYQSAGATYSQALQFYNLMSGRDKNFNSYYKQKG